MTPSRASRRPTLSASAAISGAYSRIGGEVAAEVRLPVRAAEDLVVRRHDVDLARRAHPQLNARAAEVVAVDALLDDPALLVEEREVLLDVDLLVLELDRRANVARRRVEVEQRVAEPAHALVELERLAPGRQGCARGAPERAGQVAGASDVETDRVLDVLVREHLPASGLRPEPAEGRVAAVDRELERLGKPRPRRRVMQNGTIIAISGSPIRRLIRSSAPGRARSFRESGSLRPSTSETVSNRLRASGVSSSGTSEK